MKELKIISNKNSDAKELNNILKNGGVVAFVTDTVWGLGCMPNSKKGVDKIYEIKNRDRSKPLILMSDDVKNLYPYVAEVPSIAEKLIKQYFPGALTVILKKSELTKDYITSNKDTVGIRVPNNKCFNEICKITEGHVLATTSANISNSESSKTYEEAVESIGKFVDAIIADEGYLCKGTESTVVLADSDSYKILRQGIVKF